MNNKVVVVTGCASGIGAETCKKLKSEGAHIIGLDLNKPAEHVDQYIPIDLSKPQSILNAVEQINKGVDVLLNIAGVPPTLPPVVQMNVNFFGLVDFTNSMTTKLNQGATIINLASVAGSRYMQNLENLKALFELDSANEIEAFLKDRELFGEVTYNFSKEAVVLWTLKMANTWSERGITMNSVSPGPVKTPILKDFMETIAKNNVLPDKFKGDPQDIAKILVFLSGDDAKWINGQNIIADGGLLASRMSQQLGL